MEDMPYIFLIPAFFLAVCVTFILLNRCCARRNLKKNEKITHQISIIDINNLASHPSKTNHRSHHHSSGPKHKLKTGLQKLTSLRSSRKQPAAPVKSQLPSVPTRSSVILMNECRRDVPPSYGSLFERPSHASQSKSSNDSTKRFMNLCARPATQSSPAINSNVSNSTVHL